MTSVHPATDQRIFRKECRSLARAGLKVTIVGPHPKDTVEELVQIKSVPRDKPRIARMTRTVWRVYQEARKLDADIYHFHDPELIPAALLLRCRGKNVIYDIHEDVPKDVMFKPYLPQWSKHFIGRLVERIEEAACKHFSAIVCVTPQLTDRLKPANPKTVTVFNYPYAEELINESPVPWNSRNLAAIYVGSITPQRGIAEMVQAMSYLSGSLGATLEIAGDAIPEDIKKLPGWSRVRYHGGLDQPSTYRLLQNARIGLVCEHPIPTFLEAIPVKIFEYMAAGLAVIASDFPFWRKMLSDVKCALYVDPTDAKGIAQAIEYLLTNPSGAEEMGRRGQAAVIKQFNWNSQARKLLDLYSSLVTDPCVG